MIEESILKLQRWNSLPSESRVELFQNLRQLPRMKEPSPASPAKASLGEDPPRRLSIAEAEAVPIPWFAQQGASTAIASPSMAQPSVEVEEVARMWRPAGIEGQTQADHPEVALLEERLKTLTEFFAGQLRSGPR